MDKRYRRLGKNTVIVFIGNAGSKLISFLMLPFYTSVLSKAEYGTSDLIDTYSLILFSFFTCCVADSIFIFPKDKSNKEKTQYFTSGLLFVFVSFIIVCIIAVILKRYIKEEFLNTYLWWIIGMTYSHFLFNYMQQFTRSIDKMMIYSLSGIVHVGAIALFSFALLPIYKLTGYLVALVGSFLVSALYAFVASKSFVYFNLRGFNRESLCEMLRYGIPLIPNSVMWWLVNGLNRPVMVSALGVEAIGLYAVANKIPGVLSLLFAVFGNAWKITMLEEFGKPDFNVFFNKTMRFLFFVTMIGAIMLILSTKLIVDLFVSNNFYEAWIYVPVLTIGAIMHHLSSLVGGVFAAEKKSKYFFYSSIWGAITSVIFTFILVRLFGLMGVCISVVLSFLCIFIARLKYAWRFINKFDFRYYIINFLILICTAIIYIIDKGNMSVALLCIVVGATFFVVNKDELNILTVFVKEKFSKEGNR